ncbi:hypothetical protein [Brevibacillus formosus]|uniref:hypothetical protein n=1 Tax=Brevibacillus formosus TaxID=54913 RepID=UPI003F1D9421
MKEEIDKESSKEVDKKNVNEKENQPSKEVNEQEIDGIDNDSFRAIISFIDWAFPWVVLLGLIFIGLSRIFGATFIGNVCIIMFSFASYFFAGKDLILHSKKDKKSIEYARQMTTIGQLIMFFGLLLFWVKVPNDISPLGDGMAIIALGLYAAKLVIRKRASN